MANNYMNMNNEPDALVLTDSLARNVTYIEKTDKLFFPGCTIGALTHKIESGSIQIGKYDYIIVLIGTNDLSSKDIWAFYKSEVRQGRSGSNLPYHSPIAIPVLACLYRKLITTIRAFNPNARLAFLGLLPRPFDHHRNKEHHIQANYILKNLCDELHTSFVQTHRSFMKYGKPIEELFIDGIHPSPKGTVQLREMIINTINGFRSQNKLNII